tara:strand:+ start:3045 stop:3392 length:348 start_codon:yes stop_codon:yes gene_type:complete
MTRLKLVVNNINYNSDKESFFVKKELNTILNLYAKMVSNGTWRDYSFSANKKEISFNIYLRSSEKPILKILKNLKPKHKNEKFQIKDKNGMTLEKSQELKKIIKNLDNRVKKFSF